MTLLLRDVVITSQAVSTTSSKKAKVERMAELLGRAR